MSDLTSTTEQIRELIRRLAAADASLRVFGADMHRYRLNPCLSEDDLAAFESVNGIALPEDYREFLRRVGNGGAGPFYGLRPLSADERELARPFPFEATANMSEPVERPEGEWDTRAPGILELCHQGCTYYYWLVVSGPSHGTVWEADDDVSFFPTRLTFLQWYRSWAEKALQALENEPLVARLRAGMTLAEVLDTVKGDWQTRPASGRDTRFVEATDIPAQLEVDPSGVVVKVNPWISIVARPG